MLWFALPQTLTGLMFLAVIWTDTLMVAHYLTAADVAVYAIVTRLLRVLALVFRPRSGRCCRGSPLTASVVAAPHSATC